MPLSACKNFCFQCPCPRGEQQPPLTSAGDPSTLAGRSGSVSYGVTASSPGYWCAHYFVCALQEWSLCFPSSVEILQSNPASLQIWFSRNSSSHCWTSRLGGLTWGSEPSLQWVIFCGISVLQFMSHPPRGYGIWFYCDCTPPTISLQLLLFLWMWGIIFGEVQCLSLDDCSAVSCDSGALARESELTSFYSSILNQSPERIFLIIVHQVLINYPYGGD